MAVNSRWAGACLTICLMSALAIPNLVCAVAAVDPQASLARSKTLVAKVNSQPIYEAQLAPKIEANLAKFKKYGAAKISDSLFDRMQLQVLEQLITMELLYQAGRKLGISDIDEKILSAAAEIKKQPPASGAGKSEAELRELAKRQIYIREYMVKNQLVNPHVSEADIKAYYEQNKQNFANKEETVQARHILIQITEKATPEEREEARHKIEKARQMIFDGKPFAEVAIEFSEDNAASGGGYLGPIKRGYMPPEFDAVAFSLQPGKLSKVVHTAFGFHLLMVDERIPEGDVPGYEKLRDFVGKYLQEQYARKNLDSHLQNLRAKANIEIFLKQNEN